MYVFEKDQQKAVYMYLMSSLGIKLARWQQKKNKKIKTDPFFQGNLSCHHFREWWRDKVPAVLSPKGSIL
jgi:hypothetical protein